MVGEEERSLKRIAPKFLVRRTKWIVEIKARKGSTLQEELKNPL